MVPKFFTRKIEPAKGCCCFSSGVKRALKFRERFKLGIKKRKKKKEKEREVTMKKKKNLSLPSHAVTFLILLAPRLYATFIHTACSPRDSRWVQEKRLRLLPKRVGAKTFHNGLLIPHTILVRITLSRFTLSLHDSTQILSDAARNWAMTNLSLVTNSSS